ncbi:MAG: nitroreductase [Rhodobacteraceae bacterium]|jgi:nitroreductase|uniref:nitroreductase family protein n=1 Tax=Albidovulum sp. TaxID=1872424 RepID=UPI001D8115F6|nr:nitroreductase [uncultured Defluviimonas sp.]MCB2126269.1 nitroreductase [Paracoccaceae bacterium]MCC0069923.1 nitroreductase [Paracoccaceae bacterium]
MTTPNPAAMEFFLTRRSRPPKLLRAPVPTEAELMPILTAAARVPDHGKLEPWRFLVLAKPALGRLAALARARGAALGLEPDRIEKGVAQFADADLIVAVVMVPRPTDKIPELEQVLSAGAVCLTLLNAALASGWDACWLTGWHVHDATFAREALGLAAGERVAGLIHIGTATSIPPDRPRPDVAAITSWIRD